MKKISLTLLFIMVLALTACGWKGTGHIDRHTYDEAYSNVSFICAGYINGVCTVQVPMTDYVDESFGLDIRDEEGKIHSVTVNKKYWESAKDGDYFDNQDKE